MAERPDEDKAVALHRRAEEIFRDQPAHLADLSVEDTQALIYHLQIQRIELELQNDELRHAHLELEAARDRYAELHASEQLAHSSEQLASYPPACSRSGKKNAPALPGPFTTNSARL